MINLEKSQPPPAILEIEKAKKSGTYRVEEVQRRLQTDFKNKCYICEDSNITSIDIEHFEPVLGDRNKMFDWNNLFFACRHCNSTKHANVAYSNMLNCTNPSHEVVNWIRYSFDITRFPKITVLIDEVVSKPGVTPTIALLRDVYSKEHPFTKKMESGNLRNHLYTELAAFNDLLSNFYLNASLSEIELQEVKDKIVKHLQKESAFSAFKIWIIRGKETFRRDFDEHIPKH